MVIQKGGEKFVTKGKADIGAKESRNKNPHVRRGYPVAGDLLPENRHDKGGCDSSRDS